MKNYLGIDQSLSNTGIFVLDENQEPIHFQSIVTYPQILDFRNKCDSTVEFENDLIDKSNDVWKLTKPKSKLTKEEKTSLKTPDHVRMNYIWKSIETIIKDFNVHSVSFEGISFGGSGRVITLAMLLGGIQKLALDYNLDFKMPTPNALKKFATDNGRASKEEMIEALPEHILKDVIEYGKENKLKIDDICDAYHLSRYLF